MSYGWTDTYHFFPLDLVTLDEDGHLHWKRDEDHNWIFHRVRFNTLSNDSIGCVDTVAQFWGRVSVDFHSNRSNKHRATDTPEFKALFDDPNVLCLQAYDHDQMVTFYLSKGTKELAKHHYNPHDFDPPPELLFVDHYDELTPLERYAVRDFYEDQHSLLRAAHDQFVEYMSEPDMEPLGSEGRLHNIVERLKQRELEARGGGDDGAQ